MQFSLSKILNTSKRIRHTDLLSSWKPLIFSAGPCFPLRSNSTVLGRKLKSKCSTFNPLNFWLFTNWILCVFSFQRHPNSPEINHRWLNTFQRRFCKALSKCEPSSSPKSFSVYIEFDVILVFPRPFLSLFLEVKSLGITIYFFVCVLLCDPLNLKKLLKVAKCQNWHRVSRIASKELYKRIFRENMRNRG